MRLAGIETSNIAVNAKRIYIYICINIQLDLELAWPVPALVQYACALFSIFAYISMMSYILILSPLQTWNSSTSTRFSEIWTRSIDCSKRPRQRLRTTPGMLPPSVSRPRGWRPVDLDPPRERQLLIRSPSSTAAMQSFVMPSSNSTWSSARIQTPFSPWSTVSRRPVLHWLTVVLSSCLLRWTSITASEWSEQMASENDPNRHISKFTWRTVGRRQRPFRQPVAQSCPSKTSARHRKQPVRTGPWKWRQKRRRYNSWLLCYRNGQVSMHTNINVCR